MARVGLIVGIISMVLAYTMLIFYGKSGFFDGF